MRHARTSSRPAFTMIEILVVVVIIVALIAILLPSFSRIRTTALKAGATQVLSTIKIGLTQYYADFNVYPPSSPGNGLNSGASMLAEGLLGFQAGNVDGAGANQGDSSDFGFRLIKPRGNMGARIYGDYVPRDAKFFRPSTGTFIDPWENDIVYYRSSRSLPGTTVTIPSPAAPIFGAAGSSSYFVASDCTATVTKLTSSPATPPVPPTPATLTQPQKSFYALITGSSPSTPNIYNIQGSVTGSSSFLLISAGADSNYFSDDDVVDSK